MTRLFMTFFFLCAVGQSVAHPLKPDTRLTVPIACGGLLRVAVKGDLIQDVVVYPEERAERLTLHKSGQIFLDTKGLTQSLTLTIMTQRGITQDMKLSCSTTGAVGPLIFEPEEKAVQPKETSKES